MLNRTLENLLTNNTLRRRYKGSRKASLFHPYRCGVLRVKPVTVVDFRNVGLYYDYPLVRRITRLDFYLRDSYVGSDYVFFPKEELTNRKSGLRLVRDPYFSGRIKNIWLRHQCRDIFHAMLVNTDCKLSVPVKWVKSVGGVRLN